jgi:hypothetical protein
VITADDDVLLDIDVVELSPAGLRQLEAAPVSVQTAWYQRRRREALAAAGLVGAFNPLQPRGKDGKWIEKWGWVRWLENGQWKRGRVTDIDKDGNSTVTETATKQQRSFDRFEARRRLFTTAKTKATLELPSPGAHKGADGFTQIGGQGGSNPGALYQVTDQDAVKGNLALTPSMMRESLKLNNVSPHDVSFNETDSVTSVQSKIGQPSIFIDKSNNKAYLNLSGGVLWDLDTGDIAEVEEVFGLPDTPRRHDVLGQLEVYDPGDVTTQTKILQTARSLGVGRPTVDTKFYVKTSKSPEHARNEALANDLYELAGVSVPNVAVGKDGNTISSEIVTGDSVQPLSNVLSDPDIMKRVREDFVIDAWLANWDVAGLGLDNMVIVDGQPYRIDAGGALLYRAQGNPKGNKFGNEVTELDSLTNPSVNPQAAKVFGKVTPGEMADGAQRLAAISPQQIINAVEAQNLDKSLADKLIARRKYILDKTGIIEPKVDDILEELLDEEPPSTPVLPITPGNTLDVGTGTTVYDPKTKSLVPGTALSVSAQNDHDAFITSHVGPLKGDGIVGGYINGDKLVVSTDGSLWEVTGVEPTSGTGGSYNLNIRHLGTGEVSTMNVYDDTTYYATTDTDGSLAADYAPVYDDFQTYAVNSYTSVSDMLNDGWRPELKTAPTHSGVTLKPGDWIIRGSIASTKPGAYRVDSVADNGYVYATSMSGEKLATKPGFDWRQAGPGTMVNQTLDAIKARNDAAAHADILAGYSDGIKTAYTPSDQTLAKLNASTPTPPNPAVTPVVVDPDTLETHFDPETGINESLKVLGDPVPVTELKNQNPDDWVGKWVYVRKSIEPKADWKGYKASGDQGMFKIAGDDWSGGYGVWAYDSTGLKQKIDPYGNEVMLIDGEIPPVVNLQFKKDHTIAVNGHRVGSWSGSGDHWYHDYKVQLDPDYTVSGQVFRAKVGQKAAMRTIIVPMLMPHSVGGSKDKSTASIELEHAVRADVEFGAGSAEVTETGTADTLLDGSKATLGMWVISKTDGKVGKISTIEKGTGYVKVTMDDGTIKGRAASTLSAAADPSSGAIPPYSPLYKDVKLADGSGAFPSQGVLVGDSSATIVMIKPDGNVRIVDSSGKFTWTKATKLSPAKTFSVKTQADVHNSPAVGIALSTDAWKTVGKPGKVQYAAPGDVTIPQTSNAVEIYREFAHTRKLTRDGFVPAIGMHVRDAEGHQLVITRIAQTHSGNPSTVWTVDVDNIWADPVGRQPSRLWVDHAAELATADGQPLPKVSSFYMSANDKGVSLPSGAIVYSYEEYDYVGNRNMIMKKYFMSMPDGTARAIHSNGIGEAIAPDKMNQILTSKKPQKIAYADELSDTMITFESVLKNSYGSQVISGLWIHSTADGALEQLKAEVHQKKLDAGIVEPEKFSGSIAHLIRLPKPSTAPKTGDVVAPTNPPPLIVAEPDRLRGAPAIGGSYSIESGITQLRVKKAAGGPGSHTLYSMGDSDYIEDMSIRVQASVDQDGVEYNEVRFRLLEDKVDDLADRLIISDNGKVGDWKQAEMHSPDDLVAGDSVSIRISSTGTLKPDDGYYPNATVVGIPVKVGVTDNGFDAYEVQVAMASGTVGRMILEKRPVASVRTFEWDPLKPIPSKNFQGSVNPDAINMGWSMWQSNAVGYEALSGSNTMVDKAGNKLFDLNKPAMTTVASQNGAMRLRFDAGDGGSMLVQVTHTAAEKRVDTINHNGDNRSRRATVNGEVIIRVRADDPEGLSKISQMMSAAGVPPEAQGQPTGIQLRKMALNKVAKQLAPSYQHMRRPDVTGEDDASATAVLSMIQKRAPALGRPATMDDILIRTGPDGRVQVVFSDEVAEAMTKNFPFDYAYHSFSFRPGGSFTSNILNSPVATGLMSTDERWSQGILISGGSSKDDVSNDAGNRIFFRVAKGKKENLVGDNLLFISGVSIAKLVDTYFNPGDRYGKRSYSNGSQYGSDSYLTNNEIMIKKKVDPEMFGFVIVGSESVRQKRISELKASGVTEIGGRAIEDVIVVSGTKTSADLGSIGQVWGTEVPITSIPGAPVSATTPTPTGILPTVPVTVTPPVAGPIV